MTNSRMTIYAIVRTKTGEIVEDCFQTDMTDGTEGSVKHYDKTSEDLGDRYADGKLLFCMPIAETLCDWWGIKEDLTGNRTPGYDEKTYVGERRWIDMKGYNITDQSDFRALVQAS